jgi:hypothetical protein
LVQLEAPAARPADLRLGERALKCTGSALTSPRLYGIGGLRAHARIPCRCSSAQPAVGSLQVECGGLKARVWMPMAEWETAS